MSIRKIEEADFNGIKKLVFQIHKLHIENRPDIYNDIDPFDRTYFDFLMKDERTIALVYEMDGNIVGFCVVTLREPSKNPLMKARNIAYMEDLCVDENYRKKGIGKSLFDEIKIQARDKGSNILELMVWSFNINAIDFYKGLDMTCRSHIMELIL